MSLRVPAGNEVPNKNINKSNAQHAIVFEAVALALAIDAGTELLSAGVSGSMAALAVVSVAVQHHMHYWQEIAVSCS